MYPILKIYSFLTSFGNHISLFAHKLIEALFLWNGVLLFNFGQISCTTDAVITPSRKESHVVEVLCFDANK